MVLNLLKQLSMVGVAQLVRAPGCGPGGRGFKSHHSPKKQALWLAFFYFVISIIFSIIINNIL